MIKLTEIALSDDALSQLAGYQVEIDRISDYSARVDAAKTRFAQRNRDSNRTFRAVRATLAAMCSGAKRCAYCEDSAADEVEHIRPKNLYPEHVFVWENYVYACGPCNGPKNNRYAVFNSSTGELIEITRRHDDPVVPPLPGDEVFLNPRSENPLDHLTLDLRDTFWLSPRGDPSSREYRRAEFTIDVLRLNDRDELPAARAEAFGSYRARLSEYIRDREAGRSQSHLDSLIAAVRKMGHPTVWHEMKRQQHKLPDLKRLFDEAPEALIW